MTKYIEMAARALRSLRGELHLIRESWLLPSSSNNATLAGYAHAGMRIVVQRGDYDARLVEHLFPQGVVPEQALEIANAHGANPLFVKCAEYVNEVEWPEFPNGGHPYFVPA